MVNPQPYRPLKRRSHRWLLPAAVLVTVVVVGVVWWAYSSSDDTKSRASGPSSDPAAQASASSPGAGAVGTGGGTIERGEAPPLNQEEPKGDTAARIQAGIEAGQRALERNDLITAQVQFSAALKAGATGQQATDIRARLVKIADQLVFTPEHYRGDPHTLVYLVQKGDTLLKIAKAHKTTPELIARINNLVGKTMIREGTRLKVVKGPMNAIVLKKQYTLDVYLDDVMIRTYKVGLGEHDSTPTGTWRVKNKLKNPTYFPPRGGRIVQADDPNNPLGEHWIGLEGVSGDAKNQERYGIHGTNEPDSIGKNSSMGCIRLHNADAADLYELLIVGESQVVIKD